MVALLARDLMALAGADAAETAFLGGLLQDVGRPIVSAFLLELEKHAEARRAFEQTLAATAGKHADAHLQLGLEYHHVGEFEAAAEQYQQAIAQSGDRLPVARNNLGVVLVWQGRFNEAEQEFARAVRQSRGKLKEAQQNLTLCQQRREGRERLLLARVQVELPRVLPKAAE